MTWKNKHSSRPSVPVDRCRPFTELTWQLVCIMLIEDQATPQDIAKELMRDPRDVARQIREAQKSGLLTRVEADLLKRGGQHALKISKMLREAVAEGRKDGPEKILRCLGGRKPNAVGMRPAEGGWREASEASVGDQFGQRIIGCPDQHRGSQ